MYFLILDKESLDLVTWTQSTEEIFRLATYRDRSRNFLDYLSNESVQIFVQVIESEQFGLFPHQQITSAGESREFQFAVFESKSFYCVELQHIPNRLSLQELETHINEFETQIQSIRNLKELRKCYLNKVSMISGCAQLYLFEQVEVGLLRVLQTTRKSFDKLNHEEQKLLESCYDYWIENNRSNYFLDSPGGNRGPSLDEFVIQATNLEEMDHIAYEFGPIFCDQNSDPALPRGVMIEINHNTPQTGYLLFDCQGLEQKMSLNQRLALGRIFNQYESNSQLIRILV